MERPPEGYPHHPPPLRSDGRQSASWCHSLTDHRINCKLKTKIANTILLLRYLDQICLILIGGFWQASQIYIVEGGYKRELEPVSSPQTATLHSTGNTSVKKEVSHSNTRGIVRLCSIPTEILLHIFNILCGLKVISSRRLQ